MPGGESLCGCRHIQFAGEDHTQAFRFQIGDQARAHSQREHNLAIMQAAQQAGVTMHTVPVSVTMLMAAAFSVMSMMMISENVAAIFEHSGLAIGNIVDGKSAATTRVMRQCQFVICGNGNSHVLPVHFLLQVWG